MKALTIVSYLVLAAIVVTVLLTATSSGRIGWDESVPVIVGLVVLYLVLGFAGRRRRGA